MLKATIDRKNKEIAISAGGSTIDIAQDLAYLLSVLYSNIHKTSAAAAEGFRAGIVAALTAPESPIWEVAADNLSGIVEVKRGKEKDIYLTPAEAFELIGKGVPADMVMRHVRETEGG